MNNDPDHIIPLGLAPEGMPMPDVKKLSAFAIGLIATLIMSAFGGWLHAQVRRVEAKLDAAIVATPPPSSKGCPCCLRTK